MEEALRNIIHETGYKAVYEALHKILEDDYRFLQTLYGTKEAEEEAEEEAKQKETKEVTQEANEEGEAKQEDAARKFADNPFDTIPEKRKEEADKDDKPKEEIRKKRGYPFYTIRTPDNPERVARAAKRKELQDKGIRRKDLLTKKNLETWLKEGRSYEAMANEVGITPQYLRKNCEKHGLEKTKGGKEIEERKKAPDDYAAIIQNAEALQMKHEECRAIAKESVIERLESGNEALDTRAGIYGIFTKKTQECIYIGSTQNFQFRYEMHRKKYDNEADLYVFKVIREQGGWDNHIFIPLEYRETTNGLNVIEAVWYDSLLPVGNKLRPL